MFPFVPAPIPSGIAESFVSINNAPFSETVNFAISPVEPVIVIIFPLICTSSISSSLPVILSLTVRVFPDENETSVSIVIVESDDIYLLIDITVSPLDLSLTVLVLISCDLK